METRRTPAYLALYERLRREIIEGDYPFGSRMPSKRQLSEETGLSLVTVEHALSLLCDEGYLEARERSGHFAVFRKGEGFLPAEVTPARPEGRAAPEREAVPISVLSRTMRRVITERGETLLERRPPGGCAELRGALSRYLGRARGIRTAPERIYIGSGAEYLYGLIVQALGRERVGIVCGPSITMAPSLLVQGAFDLAGLVVTDADMAFESACGTAVKKMFASGKKASLRRDDVKNLR